MCFWPFPTWFLLFCIFGDAFNFPNISSLNLRKSRIRDHVEYVNFLMFWINCRFIFKIEVQLKKYDYTILYHDISTTIIEAERTKSKCYNSRICANVCNHLSNWNDFLSFESFEKIWIDNNSFLNMFFFVPTQNCPLTIIHHCR